MQSTQQWCRVLMPSDPRSNTALAAYPCNPHTAPQTQCQVYVIKREKITCWILLQRELPICFLQDSPFLWSLLQTLVKIFLCFWERWIVSEATNKYTYKSYYIVRDTSTPWHEFISNTELSSHQLQFHFHLPKGILALTLLTAYKHSKAVGNPYYFHYFDPMDLILLHM